MNALKRVNMVALIKPGLKALIKLIIEIWRLYSIKPNDQCW